jgi:dUTPase
MIKFFIEPGYDVKAPERDYGNAGVDCFIPNYTETFEKAFNEKNAPSNAYLEYSDSASMTDEVWIVIPAHGRANIPSGLRCRIESNVALEAHNKSGIATKYGLVFGASTCDANYQGIIHISLINTSNDTVKLPLGMKVVQFIPRVIDITPIEVCTDISLDEFYKDFEFSNRGEGAFGSTGV